MNAEKNELYHSLRKAYSKAYPLKSSAQVLNEVVKIWTGIKNHKNLSELVSQKCLELKDKELQSKSNFFSRWNKIVQKSSENEPSTQEPLHLNQNVSLNDLSSCAPVDGNPVMNSSNSFEELKVTSSEDGTKKDINIQFSQTKPTPIQTKHQQEIDFLNTEIVALVARKETGLFNEDMRKDLQEKRKLLTETTKKLRRKKGDMIRKRKSRKEFKKKLTEVCDKFPEVKKDLKVCNKVMSQRNIILHASFV